MKYSEIYGIRFMPEISLDKYFKFHGHQSVKLQLSYEIVWLCTEFADSILIPLKTINIVSYNKFSKPRPGQAGF